jgi:hypothetical protein
MATSKASAKAMQDAQERKWQVQSAVETLKRADEIRKDRGMMKEVKAHVQQLHKSVIGTPRKK